MKVLNVFNYISILGLATSLESAPGPLTNNDVNTRNVLDPLISSPNNAVGGAHAQNVADDGDNQVWPFGDNRVYASDDALMALIESKANEVLKDCPACQGYEEQSKRTVTKFLKHLATFVNINQTSNHNKSVNVDIFNKLPLVTSSKKLVTQYGERLETRKEIIFCDLAQAKNLEINKDKNSSHLFFPLPNRQIASTKLNVFLKKCPKLKPKTFLLLEKIELNLKPTLEQQVLIHGRHCDKWMTLDITDVVSQWTGGGVSDNYGLLLKFSEGYARTAINLLELDDAITIPHLEVEYQTSPDSRTKRSPGGVGIPCSAACCLRPLTINFDRIGVYTIYQPKELALNFCSGHCNEGPDKNDGSLHSVMLHQSGNKQTCCFPTHYARQSILYENNDGVPTQEDFNLVAARCTCL